MQEYQLSPEQRARISAYVKQRFYRAIAGPTILLLVMVFVLASFSMCTTHYLQQIAPIATWSIYAIYMSVVSPWIASGSAALVAAALLLVVTRKEL